MKIPDLMQSVSEVLTTAEELIEAGEDVGPMLASFLRTLLVDLDKVLVDQGPTGVRPQPRSTRRHMDCGETVCLAKRPDECPHARTPAPTKARKSKRPIVNKYDGVCQCQAQVPAGEGFVVANDDPNAKRKWQTFCKAHVPKEAT